MPIRQYREPVNAVKWVFVAIIAIWVIIIVSLISRSIHVIRPEEQGIILRLGAFNRTADPGLCFTMPFVEELYRLPVKRQLKEEFGFRTIKTRTIKTPNTYNPDELPKESRMITGDLNAADVEWVTQYRISDPRKFLFKVRNPE